MKRSLRDHIKAFILGSCYPVMIVPFMKFSFAYKLNPIDRLNFPTDVIRVLYIENVPLVLPLYFGAWNVLYFMFRDRYLGPKGNTNLRYWVWGMIFGLGLATYGLVVHDLSRTLYHLTGFRRYMPLPVATLIYGLLWRYSVKNVNRLFGLEPAEGADPAPIGVQKTSSLE